MQKEIETNKEVLKMSKERLKNLTTHATFEVFPDPRVLPYFENTKPSGNNISVTASHKRPIEASLSVALQIADYGHNVTAHLPAKSIRDLNHIEEIGGVLLSNNINRIFVVGGDLPKPEGEFISAMDLLRGIKKVGLKFEKIGVAGYPEGHSFISKEDLEKAIFEKQKFADESKTDMYIVTQMCFNPKAVNDWALDLKKKGLTLPVISGVVGPVNLITLAKFAARVGYTDSANFLKKVDLSKELTLEAAKNYKPDKMVEGLVRSNLVEGLHIYTFNEVKATNDWVNTKE